MCLVGRGWMAWCGVAWFVGDEELTVWCGGVRTEKREKGAWLYRKGKGRRWGGDIEGRRAWRGVRCVVDDRGVHMTFVREIGVRMHMMSRTGESAKSSDRELSCDGPQGCYWLVGSCQIRIVDVLDIGIPRFFLGGRYQHLLRFSKVKKPGAVQTVPPTLIEWLFQSTTINMELLSATASFLYGNSHVYHAVKHLPARTGQVDGTSGSHIRVNHRLVPCRPNLEEVAG